MLAVVVVVVVVVGGFTSPLRMRWKSSTSRRAMTVLFGRSMGLLVCFLVLLLSPSFQAIESCQQDTQGSSSRPILEC